MRVLAVETSTNVASCAIMDDDQLLGEFLVNDTITHSQKLLPLISLALESCKLDITDIDVFAASVGPGSFTGLRIGIATINGLAQSTNKPVVAVSSLQALAQNVAISEKLIVPIIDARRDRVFTGAYKSNDELTEVIAPDVIEVAELLDELEKKDCDILFVGEGIPVYKEIIVSRLGNRAQFPDKNINIARASSVAELAIRKANMGETMSFFEMVPEYLRETQAQREYDEKQRNLK